MPDPTHIESPPAGANAGSPLPAADQRRIITDRLPVPPRRSRTRTAPGSPAASRRVRWIVGGIIALVVIGGGVLLYMQDAAARREAYIAQLRAERERVERSDRLDEQLRQARNEVQALERRIERLRSQSSSEDMRFSFLRRFDTGALGTAHYQGVLNETHECVLYIDEAKVVTNRMGLKSYVGKAEKLGEVAFKTEAGTTKYMDTYGSVDASDAAITEAQAKLERARAALVAATEARAAEPPLVPIR